MVGERIRWLAERPDSSFIFVGLGVSLKIRLLNGVPSHVPYRNPNVDILDNLIFWVLK